MIEPVIQFVYQWTLKSEITGAEGHCSGDVFYHYRSNKLEDALSSDDIWCINIYTGDGQYTLYSASLNTAETNDFIKEHLI